MTINQERVAVVTGANRGIGLEICRQLARRGVSVVLTARKPETGEAAIAKLASEGLRVDFHPLSVTDEVSIQKLRDHIESRFRRLDILVNNAGVFAEEGGLNVSLKAVHEMFEINTLAPLRIAQVFVPLLKKSRGGRIVNMSSGMGALTEMQGGYAAYRISKTALNAVTSILATELTEHHIVVNSMCPGWVRTDMGGANADRDVAEGADTAVWLALDAPQSLTGKFHRDRQIIPW